MSIQLSAPDTVIWSGEVELLQTDGKRRPCNGNEELDLCSFNDAVQIRDLANQVKPGFELALIYGRVPYFGDSNKLSTTYNPGTNVLVANNQPCLGDAPAGGNGTYLYLTFAGPRCWHIINQAAKMEIICGRMWRAWKGEQAMAIKNFGSGDTLVWA